MESIRKDFLITKIPKGQVTKHKFALGNLQLFLI